MRLNFFSDFAKKKFGGKEKWLYFCTRFRPDGRREIGAPGKAQGH